MKKIFVLFFLLPLINCTKDEPPIDPCAETNLLNKAACESFINVTSPCVITEVDFISDGQQFSKYVYHYNGVNYTKIDYYFRNMSNIDFPLEPFETHTLEYEDNKISEVIIQETATPEEQFRLSYTYNESTVTTIFEVLENGVVMSTNSFDQLFVINPSNSFFIDNNRIEILREYKDGNSIRIAEESTSSECLINEKKWNFVKRYYFDSNPNVFRDYAVRFPVSNQMDMPYLFWLGNNSNNVLSEVDLQSGQELRNYCYKFLRNGDNIWIKEFSLVSEFPYTYRYKYSCE